MAELRKEAVAARDQAARARVRLGLLVRHHLGGLGVGRRGRRRRGGLLRVRQLRVRLVLVRRLLLMRLLVRLLVRLLLGVRVAVLTLLPALPRYGRLRRLQSETGRFVRAVVGSPVITHAHISTLPKAPASTRVTDL
ncbi:hypothetical protein GCM10009837_66290 [Streptomyces durmitorensis]